MGRLIKSKCRLCRREGFKLYLRGARCDSAKCAMVRRDYPPGMHGWRRGKFSDYGVRIREKQRLKRYYGIMERQFRRCFAEASRSPGNTGEALLILMERRLDNVVYRLGFAISRDHAKQVVAHGHISVNGRKHAIPSALVRVDDIIEPGRKQKSLGIIKAGIEASRGRQVPSWLELTVTEEQVRARVAGLPSSSEVKEVLPVKEQMIVEICTR